MAGALDELDTLPVAKGALDELDALPVGNQAPTIGGGEAFLQGAKRGFKRAIQGIQQIGAHAGIAGPEDINPPLGEEAAKAFDARLRASILPEEAALAPVQRAHPWLYGGGNVLGGVAATAPIALAVPGGGYTALALQGGLAGLAQPALGPDYGKEKLQQGAVATGLSLVGGGILKGGLPTLASLWNFPKGLLNLAQTRSMETPYAQRGLEAARETGMTLSPAMVSGSRIATQAENVARQSMWSSDKALESYQMLSRQAVENAERLTRDWTQGRGAPDAITLGKNLREVTGNAVTAIHDRAGQQWNRDMAEVVKQSPPSFNFGETKQVLKDVISENEHNINPEGMKLKAHAEGLLSRIETVEQASVKAVDMNTLMDLADNAYQRAVARYPERADQVVAAAGGFAQASRDRGVLTKVYQELNGLSQGRPERVLGPKPDEPVSLARRVKELGGLNVSHMPDVIGESKLSPTVRTGMPSGLFLKEGGRSPDDMARALVEEGYLQPSDIVGDDGVGALYRKLGDEIAGRGKSYRAEDVGAAETRQRWESEAARSTGAVAPESMPIPNNPVPISVAIALRRDYGKAAKGTGRVFDDIHPSEDRRLAGRLFGALNTDFESAANNAGGAMGDAFRRANQNYKTAMGSIDYIENSVLGKALGKDVTDALYSGAASTTGVAPERLAESIARLPASSLEQAKIILEQHNPALLQDLKAYTLQQAIERGQTLAPSMGTRITFDPAKAATGLLNPKQRAALYSPEESRAVEMFDESLRRWADRHGYNFSGTALTSEFLQWFNRLGMGVLGLGTAAGSVLAGGPAGIVGAAAAGKGTLNYIFGTRQIAEAMLNPGDRMQLLTLVRLPEGNQRAAQIAGALLAKYGTQQNVPGNQ